MEEQYIYCVMYESSFGKTLWGIFSTPEKAQGYINKKNRESGEGLGHFVIKTIKLDEGFKVGCAWRIGY